MTPTLATLSGCWTRSLIAWPDGRRDVSSAVTWLQGPTLYADLRQPSPPAPAASLRALTRAQVLALADQEGFAGTLVQHADGSFEWQRRIDFQPTAASADRGFLTETAGMMVETGYAEPYREHWHRAAGDVIPARAVALQEVGCDRQAQIVWVGRQFMVARDRATPLRGGHLREHIAQAASLETAQDLVDCEISLGTVTDAGWRIDRSTLPYRVGAMLNPHFDPQRCTTADVDPYGRAIERFWTVTAEDSDVAV